MFIVSTATKRKRRSGLYLGLSIIVILSITAISILYYLGTLSQRVDRELTKGLDHYQEGSRLISSSIARMGSVGKETDSAKRSSIKEDLKRDLSVAEKELAKALNNFKKMEKLSYFNWEKETSELMKASTEETAKAAVEIYALIDKTDDIAALLTLVSDGASKFQQATNESNKLVLMSNAGRHEEVKKEANTVASLFNESKNMINKANLIDEKAELTEFLEQVKTGEILVANLIKMADDVGEERFEDYQKRRKESNALIDQLTKTAESAMIINPVSWIDSELEESIKGLRGFAKNAEEFHKKALDLWSDKT